MKTLIVERINNIFLQGIYRFNRLRFYCGSAILECKAFPWEARKEIGVWVWGLKVTQRVEGNKVSINVRCPPHRPQ